MPLTKEQLLIPRVKCAIRYPDSPFPVGAILEQDFEEPETYNYTDSNRRPWMIENPELYPETFIQLPWWSDRKPEDMPDFLFCPAKKSYYIVEEWGLDSFVIYGRTKRQYCNYLPATKEEYTAYINQKQQ